MLFRSDDILYSGKVEKIYPSGTVSGTEVYVTIIIDILDEDENLKPNFSANLDILIENKKDALLVPYDALVSTPSGYALKVKDMDTEEVQMVRVETGIEGDLSIEVISDNLEEGMTVLIETILEAGEEADAGLMLPGMGGGPGDGSGPPDGGGQSGRSGGPGQ